MAALHSDDLPEVRPDEQVEALRLLSNRRDEIVALRVQAVCRIHRDHWRWFQAAPYGL